MSLASSRVHLHNKTAQCRKVASSRRPVAATRARAGTAILKDTQKPDVRAIRTTRRLLQIQTEVRLRAISLRPEAAARDVDGTVTHRVMQKPEGRVIRTTALHRAVEARIHPAETIPN